MKLDVLAFAAHPDDIELSCAGTLIKMVRLGYKVGIVDFTRGELGTRGTTQTRSKESQESTRIMDLAVRENLKMADGNVEINQVNRLKVVRVIRRYQPTFLLMPNWVDRHPDHEHTGVLSREASFYAGLEKIHTKLDGKWQEPYRPKIQLHYMQTYEFVPSFIVDVSEEFHTRMQAIKAFKSQFYDPNSQERETSISRPDFLEGVEARARRFGIQICVKYGEPFFSIQSIGLNNLFSLIF
jgi:bacillithiol biosynthesis deacetylase BshB1